MTKFFLTLMVLTVWVACSKKGGSSDKPNQSPVVSLAGELTGANPFTFRFTSDATDQEFDPLTYTWDFGEGTTKTGAKTESFSFPADRDFTVKVTVSDGKSAPASATLAINTRTTTITLDAGKTHQTMEGFGGFGAQREYWSNGPFTSDEFVGTLINDLGLTILRDNIPSNFEITNDNADPVVTDLSKYNINARHAGHDGALADHIEYLKKMKEAGLQKFIVSIWTPAPWMKHNNGVGNGTQNQNSAPAYTTSPTATTNQLKTDMYQEFAEYCVAYIKIIKRETGLDVYALSLQNEPRFSQFYASCVYNGEALRDVVKVVGKRLRDEGLSTKIFLPEDVGWLQGVEGLTKPTLNDPEARQYTGIVAVHGYDLDGLTAASPNAQTWQTMYGWGAPYNLPLWMTETSGFKNDHEGAMALAKAMFTAIRFGNVSAWVFWSLSTSTLDDYSLMSSAGAKSKRYYVSRNFYRFIRPGAVRHDVAAPDGSGVYPLAFKNGSEASSTIVLINDSKTASKAVKLAGTGIAANYQVTVTSASDNSRDAGTVNGTDVVLLPPHSVVTLYKK
jgi:O-glycosyl hydrolase